MEVTDVCFHEPVNIFYKKILETNLDTESEARGEIRTRNPGGGKTRLSQKTRTNAIY